MNSSDSGLPPEGGVIQQALHRLIETLESRRIRYAIIGGIAAIQHARVRTTDDIDAILNLPQISMPGLFETLSTKGFNTDPIKNTKELRDHGLTTIHFQNVLIDLMLPILPVYAHVIERATPIQILGQSVNISSAESLLVMKLIACRPQDEADINDLLAAYRGKLDLNYVKNELSTVFADSDPRWKKLEKWTEENVE